MELGRSGRADVSLVTYTVLDEKVDTAICSLLNNDKHLLEVSASERSIAHKLAEHLASQFTDWDVDCEYNRQGTDKKRLTTTKQETLKSSTTGRVFPDIIVHKRGTDNNLLAVEIKKHCRVDLDELQRVVDFVRQAELGYQYALFLGFATGRNVPKNVVKCLVSIVQSGSESGSSTYVGPDKSDHHGEIGRSGIIGSGVTSEAGSGDRSHKRRFYQPGLMARAVKCSSSIQVRLQTTDPRGIDESMRSAVLSVLRSPIGEEPTLKKFE